MNSSVLLWPNGAPQAKGTEITDQPALTIHLPPDNKATGAAIVVCPGGGFSKLALDNEGLHVAQWLNSVGVAAFVLRYRLRPNYEPSVAVLDAQRAIRYVRYNAKTYNLDSGRIGILGFSAGGHLSASAATNFDKRHYKPVDTHDQVNCRPDFAVLIYPAYLLEGRELAAEIRVSKQTPPTFLVHAGDDGISAENSARFYLALKQAGVAGELHIYSNGGHGFGLRPSKFACSNWPRRCEAWLRAQGLLVKK